MSDDKIKLAFRISSKLIIASIVVLLGIIFLTIFMLQKSKNSNLRSTKETSTQPTSHDVTIYPTQRPPEDFIETKKYKARQFNPSDLYLGHEWRVKYPSELTKFSD